MYIYIYTYIKKEKKRLKVLDNNLISPIFDCFGYNNIIFFI